MKSIKSMNELKNQIWLLEAEHLMQGKELRMQFNNALSGLGSSANSKFSFMNIIKNSGVLQNGFGSIAGLAVGYLSKKIIVGSTGGVFRNILGTLVQLGIGAYVARRNKGEKKTN
ncbi:MAG: hypothetical protein IPO21_17085 [Bacteroidales bacterium]|nr:hypothetical protein [Bacteroidales bacterium]